VNVLRGSRDAVTTWANAGADIVLGGHIHLPYIRSLRTVLQDLSRDLWTAQAGTAVSTRIRERIPNSVNLIRCLGPRRCVIERWDHVETAAAFEPREHYELTFGPGAASAREGGNGP